ncbi:MAG: hypothetical protein ACQES5_09520 [Thermodesulfobacteriota bacterium]
MSEFENYLKSEESKFPGNIHELLERDEVKARSIVHSLQAGCCLDERCGGKFRYFELNLDLWREFFSFLGYKVITSEFGGETFYYLESASSEVSTVRLKRGATFIGLYLAWYFMSQGMESMDHVRARKVHETLYGSFDFNMLVAVFNPAQKGMKTRQEQKDQKNNLKKWMRSGLDDLHRIRCVELAPNMRARWENLEIYRLPGLQRFWELARYALAENQRPGDVDLKEIVAGLWNGADSSEECEAEIASGENDEQS